MQKRCEPSFFMPLQVPKRARGGEAAARLHCALLARVQARKRADP